MEQQLWRAVAAYRGAALLYVAVLVAGDAGSYTRPHLAYGLLVAMAAWSALTVVSYPRRRRAVALVIADVLVAAGLVLATRAVQPAAHIDAGVTTLPAAWAAAPVLAAAVATGPWGGALAATVVSAADIAERGALTRSTFNGIILLLLAGVVGGYLARLAVQAERVTAAAARREAARAERDRLARDIHESVLQVLALVARRGRELGGEAAELAALAGEQEVALRSLVANAPAPDDGEELDLRGLLEPLARPDVIVSAPAQRVPLAAAVAREVAAAVRAALDNVAQHAGPHSRAWVLVEDEPDAVTVSVRDDGTGFGPGRLEAAESAGRMGVALSIRGRLAAVGGTATVHSAPGIGTEVELRVPRL